MSTFRPKRLWQALYRQYGVRGAVRFGRDLHLGMGTVVDSTTGLDIGDDVYIGKGCTVECNGSIGDGVMIANRVGLVGRHDHDVSAIGRSVRRAPWIGDADFDPVKKAEQLVVEDDVWVGYGAIVLSGVTVRRGAIVAAGALVTKDVPAYAIVAGVPARRVGWRFTDAEVRAHEAALYGRSLTPPRGDAPRGGGETTVGADGGEAHGRTVHPS